MALTVFDAFVKKYGRLPTEVDPDYLEMLRMSKYRILDIPDVTPHKCANCGSTKNDGRRYIDFGLDVDWNGVVFLCGLCVKDIARNMGMFAEFEKERDEMRARAAEIEDMHRKGAELHEIVVKTFKEFEDFYGHLHIAGNEPSISDSTNVGDESATDKPAITATESKSTKSTSSSRRTNVPSLADLIGSDPNNK